MHKNNGHAYAKVCPQTLIISASLMLSGSTQNLADPNAGDEVDELDEHDGGEEGWESEEETNDPCVEPDPEPMKPEPEPKKEPLPHQRISQVLSA